MRAEGSTTGRTEVALAKRIMAKPTLDLSRSRALASGWHTQPCARDRPLHTSWQGRS